MLNAAAYYNRYGPDKSVPSRRTRQSFHRIDCHAAYVKQDGKTVARVKSTSLNAAPEITWLHHGPCWGLLRLNLIQWIEFSARADQLRSLGSAVAGTKVDGTTAWTEKYTPFGISMVDDAANDNQAGFTGPAGPSTPIIGSPNRLFVFDNRLRSIKDSDTGLTYMQARYYDPVIGRFLSVDPVTFMDTGNPSFFNRYSYAFNDPINMIDPDGMCGTRYDDGSCEVRIHESAAGNSSASTAKANLENQLNFIDGKINALDAEGSYDIVNGSGDSLGSFTGSEIQDAWNNTSFSITDNVANAQNSQAGFDDNTAGGNVGINTKTALGSTIIGTVLHETGHSTVQNKQLRAQLTNQVQAAGAKSIYNPIGRAASLFESTTDNQGAAIARATGIKTNLRGPNNADYYCGGWATC